MRLGKNATSTLPVWITYKFSITSYFSVLKYCKAFLCNERSFCYGYMYCSKTAPAHLSPESAVQPYSVTSKWRIRKATVEKQPIWKFCKTSLKQGGKKYFPRMNIPNSKWDLKVANIGREIIAISQDINIKTENYPVFCCRTPHDRRRQPVTCPVQTPWRVAEVMLHEKHAFKTNLCTAALVDLSHRAQICTCSLEKQ